MSEIPVEHAVSLPIPTNRWGGPGYAFFASPALRRPGQPVRQDAPDRWWVVSARGGGGIVYALWKAVPFAEGDGWGGVTLPAVASTIAELKQALARIGGLMDTLAPAFFAGEAGDAGARESLSRELASFIPGLLMPQYRALASDFFEWIEG
jgi:hypothetical protein